MIKNIPLHVLVIILNPWWWVIIQRDLGVGLLVFVLSISLFIYFWQNKSRKLFLLLLTLTAVIFFVSIREAFDESIFRNSALDIQQYNKRHEFYAHDLGKIYKNRFSLTYFKNFNFPLAKLQRNFFSNLDPNLYFFASHPRERLGVDEFKKYSPIFLPFFLIGAFYSIYILFPNLLIYTVFVSLLSSIISPKYNLGPILFFALINFMISIGIIISIKKILKYLEKKA
ncbi:hypothetical protein KKE03_04495 [Patescibacteria group bacterium]|nr:hypothetical protein [Patescibacteria group bacterium]